MLIPLGETHFADVVRGALDAVREAFTELVEAFKEIARAMLEAVRAMGGIVAMLVRQLRTPYPHPRRRRLDRRADRRRLIAMLREARRH